MLVFLVIILFISGILYLGGFLLSKYPPDKRNLWYGYRTLQSVKSEQSWCEANRYASKITRKIALVLATSGSIILLLTPDDDKIQGIFTVILVFISASLINILTEKHLKRNFDHEGNPISNK